MKPTQGRKPKTGAAKLRVQFRNGEIAGPYTTSQLVWDDRDYAWDIVGVEPWGRAA